MLIKMLEDYRMDLILALALGDCVHICLKTHINAQKCAIKIGNSRRNDRNKRAIRNLENYISQMRKWGWINGH